MCFVGFCGVIEEMLDRKPSCFFIFTGKNGYSGYLKVHLGFKKNATIMDAKKPLVWDSLGISPVWQNNEYIIVMRMLHIHIKIYHLVV